MIKAFLVDLDGTLVDTKMANIASYKEALKIFGILNCDDALNEWVGALPWDEMLIKILPGMDINTLYEIALLKREIYPSYFKIVRVNNSLVDFLKFSREMSRLALVTSASRNSALPLLTHLKLLDYFDLTITSDDCAFRKPHPEPYMLAANRLGVLPKECFVFEDSDIGMQSATAFGAKALKIAW